MDKLKVLLGNGPRPRYHAARALVYLGELDMGGTSLFEPTGGLLSAQVSSGSLGGDREPGRGPGAWEGAGSLGGGLLHLYQLQAVPPVEHHSLHH